MLINIEPISNINKKKKGKDSKRTIEIKELWIVDLNFNKLSFEDFKNKNRKIRPKIKIKNIEDIEVIIIIESFL